MENPRPEKVAVVDEVRERLSTSASAALLTEYRGLDVTAIADAASGAARSRRRVQDLQEHARPLRRPRPRPRSSRTCSPARPPSPSSDGDGTGDAVAVAKALRDFARTNPTLVVKGGVLGTKPLDRRRRQGPRRPRAPRGAARQARRRARCPDAAVRRPAPGAAPQLRLRPQGPHRPGRRARTLRPPTRAASDAAAEAPCGRDRSRRRRRSRGRGRRPSPGRGRPAADRRRPPQPTTPATDPAEAADDRPQES